MALASVTQALSERRVAKLLLSDDTQTNVSLLVVGASLALAIAVIHVQDQGGLPGSQSPMWLKYGYYTVEISSTIGAGLIIRGKTLGWVAGAGIECRACDGICLVANCGSSW